MHGTCGTCCCRWKTSGGMRAMPRSGERGGPGRHRPFRAPPPAHDHGAGRGGTRPGPAAVDLRDQCLAPRSRRRRRRLRDRRRAGGARAARRAPAPARSPSPGDPHHPCPPRGHTAGSTCLLVEGAASPLLFTGDTLFASGTGRCDLPGGSRSLADSSLWALLETLPTDTIVLPGHGGVTTVGEEREVSDPTLAA